MRTRFSLNTTTRCHSVFSFRSPEALSRQLSEVATDRLAIEEPEGICLISGSRPRLPTRITLFTDPAIVVSISTPAPAEFLGPLRFLTQRRRLGPPALSRDLRNQFRQPPST